MILLPFPVDGDQELHSLIPLSANYMLTVSLCETAHSFFFDWKEDCIIREMLHHLLTHESILTVLKIGWFTGWVEEELTRVKVYFNFISAHWFAILEPAQKTTRLSTKHLSFISPVKGCKGCWSLSQLHQNWNRGFSLGGDRISPA